MLPWPGNETDITPVELARELGHVESRPGKKVRDWLRKNVRDRLPSPSHEWRLPPELADRVRDYFRQRN